MAADPNEPSPLTLLGVSRGTPWEEVRRAFRDAVRANHPDLHTGDPDAEQRLKALNRAWESVNTPGKWAQYVTRPAPRRSGSRPAATDPDLARVRIQRQMRGATGLLQWRLELDGELVGSIANGATSVLEAAPGRHSLRVFYERYSSVPLPIVLRAGEELRLGCRQLSNPWVNLTAPKRSLVLEALGRGRFA